MKKIFSFMLIAAGLLISGQVKAEIIPVNQLSDLTNAINNAGTSLVQLQLQTDINQTAPIALNGGKKIELDLNGYALTLPDVTPALPAPTTANSDDGLLTEATFLTHCSNFNMQNAQLTVKSSVAGGQILNTTTCKSGSISKNVNGNGIHCFLVFGSITPTQAYGYTQLNIEKGVEVISSGKDAIEVYYAQDNVARKNWDKSKGTMPGNYARYAFGVEINIDGICFGNEYGVQVSGTVQYFEGGNAPKINIKKNAEISCLASQDGSTAVYAGGYGIWTIEGYVHGSTAVYVKSGQVTMNDAVVEGTGKAYKAITATTSGIDGAQGCAIVVESNTAYPGGQDVKINGDTKVSADNGYAIEETVTTGKTEQLVGITVNGGIIGAGDGGGVKISPSAYDANKVVVYGGSVEGDSLTVGTTKLALDSIAAPGTSTINLGTEEDPIIIVTKGEPAPESTVDINDVTAGADAKLSASVEMVMNSDKKVGILYITEGTKLVIAAGKTLEAKKIIMGDNDQIVVPYNGKLIVTGNEGLYTRNVDNIILQAQGKQMATLIFKYSVVQNKQPYATIEFNSTAKQFTAVIAEGHTWDRFAMPFDVLTTYKTTNKNDIEKWGNWGTWFQVWDPATGWKEATYIDKIPVLSAFQGVALSNTSKNGDAKYEFKGRLQGVQQGTLDVKAGWNYFGNSFTADMDLDELLEQLNTQAGVTFIKFWSAEDQEWVDVSYPQTGIFGRYEQLNAMQDFMFKVNKAATVQLNYKKLIWDFNVTEE